VLLATLAIAAAIAALQRWQEPAKPRHPATLSVDELVALLDDDDRSRGIGNELARRAWLAGPDAIEGMLSHPDPAVRSSAIIPAPPEEIRVSPEVARAWQACLVRLMRQDTDQGVRQAAAMALSILARDEHLAPGAHLVSAIRRMIRDDDAQVRALGCACAMYLGAHARPLLPEILALDFANSDEGARAFVFGMLEDVEAIDDATTDWLLTALEDEDPDVRTSAANTLGTIGGDQLRVATALAARWRDEREDREVRASSLVARSHLELSEGEARELLDEALPNRERISSWSLGEADATQWVAVVAELAVAANDPVAQRRAIDALRAEALAHPKPFEKAALEAACTRIAVALADGALVDAALPDLVSALESGMSFGWPPPDASEGQLVLAALVDVCRWRGDGRLRIGIDDALRWIIDRGDRAARRWARAERQRLHG